MIPTWVLLVQFIEQFDMYMLGSYWKKPDMESPLQVCTAWISASSWAWPYEPTAYSLYFEQF